MKPHKHAELIKAWADGAQIEFHAPDQIMWRDCPNPSWFENYYYRIKPEEKKPVVRWLWADKKGCLSVGLFSEEEIKKVFGDFTIKLEWSRTEFPE